MTFEPSPDSGPLPLAAADTPAVPGAVDAHEWQAFARQVRATGFDPAEFIVTAHHAVAPAGAAPGRVVSVLRKGDGRDFDAGPGQDWVDQAARALRAGHFGPR